MSRNGIDFPFPFSIPMFQTSLCIIKAHVSTYIYANTQAKGLIRKVVSSRGETWTNKPPNTMNRA